MMKRVYFMLLILTIGLWIGCSRSTTVTTSEGEKVTVTEKGDGAKIKVEGKEGQGATFEASETGVSLPKGFPTDVPIYPGSTTTTSATMGDKTIFASLKTGDDVKKVMEFYEAQLQQKGWEIQTKVDTQQGAMLQAQKGERACTASFSRSEDKTMITLSVATEKP